MSHTPATPATPATVDPTMIDTLTASLASMLSLVREYTWTYTTEEYGYDERISVIAFSLDDARSKAIDYVKKIEKVSIQHAQNCLDKKKELEAFQEPKRFCTPQAYQEYAKLVGPINETYYYKEKNLVEQLKLNINIDSDRDDSHIFSCTLDMEIKLQNTIMTLQHRLLETMPSVSNVKIMSFSTSVTY